MSTVFAGAGRQKRPMSRCPLCGGQGRHAFVTRDLNRGIGDQRFDYACCESCRTYFLLSVPADLAPYYPQEYYTLPATESLDELARSQRSNVDMLLGLISPGRLVEIGPGEGVFARAARNADFEVTGIEMDARACEYLRVVVGVNAIESAKPEDVLATLPPSRAIVMWHVVEHLRRPWEVIQSAAANLEPGGVLVIATPNPRALQFKLLRGRWAHVDAPRHLFLIPEETLADRCDNLGLSLISSTTVDRAGRHWNRFGWEYALRPPPRSHPAGLFGRVLSKVIGRAFEPIETRAKNGCAYTAVFAKRRPS